MRIGVVLVLLLLSAAAPVWASETPRYEPAPAWVLPAPPIKQGAGLPVFALLDQQTRMSGDTVWSYRELATRAISWDVKAMEVLGNWRDEKTARTEG